MIVLVHFISYARGVQLDDLRQPHFSLQRRQQPCVNEIIFCPYLMAFYFPLFTSFLSLNTIFETLFAITSCVHFSCMYMTFHTRFARAALWSPLTYSMILEKSIYSCKKTADAEKALPWHVHLYRW